MSALGSPSALSLSASWSSGSLSTVAALRAPKASAGLRERSAWVRGAVGRRGAKLQAVWSLRAGRSTATRRLQVLAATKKSFKSFDDMIANTDMPVLVDFYATWCGPCQMIVPILSEVSAKLKGRVQVVKIDTEKYDALATKYRVAALPTLVLFVRGKPIDRIEGVLPADALIERIESVLSQGATA
eukprot:jgi/Chlat1/2123/Chrsp17S02842